MKKFALSLILLLALFSMHVSLLDIGIVKGESTIYIRADGSVEGTDKIHRDGNIYIFIDNIVNQSVVVERDDIVVYGAGYILQGTGAYESRGIDLSHRSDVTVSNMRIRYFDDGILLGKSSNKIVDNYLTNNSDGICLEGSSKSNIISGNNITNNWSGIRTKGSNNIISANSITDNKNYGIYFDYSSNNSIVGNNITNNGRSGIYFYTSSNNIVSHNNFINNTKHVKDAHSDAPWFIPPSVNIWDDGREGNYWSDYEERYPNATEIDGTGIWDTPYIIDENNQDNYPLMDEGGRFEPYVSTFHLLFEDRSHKLLGNLSGELRITEPEKEIIHSICKLSLSSPRLDEYHEPYIDKVELFMAWWYYIKPGPYPVPQPPPYPRKVTLQVDDEIILFEHSRNVSDFVEEPRIVFWFHKTKWESMFLPAIRVYFSDGQEWEWEYEHNVTLPFKLWSGIDANLNELSGKIETETITITTVKKGYPIIITSVRLTILATIIVAVAVAAVFVKYRKKQ